jgi:molecular chaperone GrpE (heat shock protein)
MYIANDPSKPHPNAIPNSPPASLATVLTGLCKSVSSLADEAANRTSEIEAQRRNENAAMIRDTAAEMLKGLAPSLQAQQKQISDSVSRVDSIQKQLADISNYLNTERQESMTEIRNLRSSEFNREVVSPLLRHICLAAKDAIRSAYELRSIDCNEVAVDKFERFAVIRQEALSTYGVCLYSAQIGEAFNPRLHEVIRREKKPTQERKLHGRIAEEESPGFMQEDVVLAKSTVFIFEYVANNQPALSAKEI